MSGSGRALQLRLHGEPIATLVRRTDGEQREIFELYFEDSYVSMVNRPVLSLRCRDWRLDLSRRFYGRMPAFLTNLLPEPHGELRRRVARAASIEESDEFSLLEFVGQDLSGALTATPTEFRNEARRTVDEARHARWSDPAESPLRLSGGLGGMQLKFSVDRRDRLSLPVSGGRGRWILKIPDGRHEGLVRAEYAALLWATDAGFDVPAVEVVQLEEVEGLPENVGAGDSEALLVRRFDRAENYQPIHMEEFTSVLNLHPEDKYPEDSSPHRYNFVAIGRLVRQFAGPETLRTFFARIIFDVLVGNNDAHLKNWAFVFPDRRRPALAPVYDIVPTILYRQYRPELALKFTSLRPFSTVDVSRIREFAVKLNESPDEFVELAQSTVSRAIASFHDAMTRARLPEVHIERLESHWRSLPIVKTLGQT